MAKEDVEGASKMSLIEGRSVGTMILRTKGCLFKVIKIHYSGVGDYIFECKDLETREDKNVQFKLTGMLEAAETAFKTMKSSKDIFFMDLDRNGEWKVFSEEELSKM